MDTFNSDQAELLPQCWWQHHAANIATLAPVQRLHWPLLQERGIEIAVKREDMLHGVLSGNKFYKLLGHLRAFQQSGLPRWLTFGGAFSNHLHAFGGASQALDVPAIAVVRGEPTVTLSPTLADVKACGVQLKFVSRSDYRRRDDAAWLQLLREELGDFYCVPEGGGGPAGAAGSAQWLRGAMKLAPWQPSAICLAAGTGCSAAGVLSASGGIPVHAFLALKGTSRQYQDFAVQTQALAKQVTPANKILSKAPALVLESNYHCGGYARFPQYLREFMLDVEQQQGLPLDPVYTAKMFWGIAEKARAGLWPPGSRLLVLHSGGLQGRRGFAELCPG